ncbi:hypothetical protein GQ457_10G000380 [Hibiscus cannabinus]
MSNSRPKPIRMDTGKKQFDKILSYIEHGKREGATLLTGRGASILGYYIQPTIFADVKIHFLKKKKKKHNGVGCFLIYGDDMIIAREEIFGPVMSLMKFRSIRAGIVWINCYSTLEQDCPFGGYKMSGFGRDCDLDSLNQYLQINSVVTPIQDSPRH